MDRRSFLKFLGIGAASIAAPKFIFDMGANLYKRQEGGVLLADGLGFDVTIRNPYIIADSSVPPNTIYMINGSSITFQPDSAWVGQIRGINQSMNGVITL